MIDHFALALGHGLLAIAMLRLVMRAGLDADPLIDALKTEAEDKRRTSRAAGRKVVQRGVQSVSEDEQARA